MGAKNLQREHEHKILSNALAGDRSRDGDACTLAEALTLQLKRHNDTCTSLARALPVATNPRVDNTLRDWIAGRTLPRQVQSLALLKSIERHYELPRGYFAGFIAKHNSSYLRRPCNQSQFQLSLSFQMNKHCDTSFSLAGKISRGNRARVAANLTNWKTGRSTPNRASAFTLLSRVESRYGLKEGYFSQSLAKPEDPTETEIRRINRAWRGAVRWHLPANFNELDTDKRQEIVNWISENVLGSNSRFGKYQSIVTRNAFSIVFPEIKSLKRNRRANGNIRKSPLIPEGRGGYGTIAAPANLSAEMQNLLDFKRAPLPPINQDRHVRWSQISAEAAAIRFGIFFGAFSAAPLSHAKGRGVPLHKLTFGMLAFPKVWDWFLRWREERRGFFSTDDVRFLEEGRALLRSPTGWIRQQRQLARTLRPISDLISASDIKSARRDWGATCDKGLNFIGRRIPEIRRIQRRHRDPFEPILPILNSDSPLSEYKKIADEVLKYMPDPNVDPFRASVSLRSYLLIRLGMHLGFRQRNLRDLMLSKRGERPLSAAQLEDLQRGELRWSDEKGAWEVFAPALAFKNSNSSFFDGQPFRLLLPDLDGLYSHIGRYIEISRPVLLAGRRDPGTFFVRSARSSHRSTAYDLFSFYEAWKTIIQRYGIYNPYTGRGAIVGLRPHGSHAVRDVIATHVLKKTASYELTSYAIQDTVATVMEHYARFLPHEKAAKAAEILNGVWSSIDDVSSSAKDIP